MKIVIVYICIIILLYVLNSMAKKSSAWQNKYGQTEKFNRMKNNLQVVNTGSTFPKYALDYSNTDYNGFNLALQPQSLTGDYKILRQFSKNIESNGIVLIGLVSFVFGFEDYEEISAYDKYYTFLDKQYIRNYSVVKKIIINYIPTIIYVKQVLVKFKRILKRITNKSKSHGIITNDPTMNNAMESALERQKWWIKEFKLKDLKSTDIPSKYEKDIFPKTRDLLKNILQYCIDNNYRPVIFIPPVSKEENGLISDEILNVFLYDNINRANIIKAPVLDYQRDYRFQSNEFYTNADCLNEKGRKLFTAVLINDLKELKYL